MNSSSATQGGKTLSVLTLSALILTFIVIVLGAYTRLTDAGLGCPDWPGCYHHLVVPNSAQAIEQAALEFPNSPVHIEKAWTEMIHRYVAGVLGLTIFVLAFFLMFNRIKNNNNKNNKINNELAMDKKAGHVDPLAPLERVFQKKPQITLMFPILLVSLIIFQALLGMWTVTMKLLPVVVMGHLLGGLMLLALLWWLTLTTSAIRGGGGSSRRRHYFVLDNDVNLDWLKPWVVVALIIVVVQIMLGGWTSSNHAALVCPNFPYCHSGLFFPEVGVHDSVIHQIMNAFNIFNGENFQLSHTSLTIIQMVHRIGALITAFYIVLLSLFLIIKGGVLLLKRIGIIMLTLLTAQIVLGILNIELILPLTIALLHNLFAALLLLTVVTLVFFCLFSEKRP